MVSNTNAFPQRGHPCWQRMACTKWSGYTMQVQPAYRPDPEE